MPAVNKPYGQRGAWQDDPATIHMTADALEACSAFKVRIPHNEQASKMADVWSIKTFGQLLRKEWKEVNTDKLLCKKLMQSIPARLQAVIALEGRQVRKEDYEGRREEYTNLPHC